MSIAIFLKNNLKNIPPNLGEIINRIPYSKRPGIGNVYKLRKKEIHDFELFSVEQKNDFIFKRMKNLVDYAYEEVVFYNEYYNQKGFHPDHLKTFEDIQRIPIVDKGTLNSYDIEKRSAKIKGRYIVNTGGSSGTPFSLYIQPDSMGHEWAHMHHIWEKLNFKASDLKIVFGGRSDLKKVVEYDVVRNHFAIDIYADYKLVAEELKKILKKRKIKYLHGYPTSIYDFAVFCKKEDYELQQLLSANLKGVFLGSEYPHEHYRNVIENVFNVKTISWYGHTERAVLAYEKTEKFTYEPFGTYGFTEALKFKDEYHLVGTSFYNFATPLIRYNTNDIIADVKASNGILKSFKVTKGREGEFVIDKNNKNINLTGLIFGRHHEIFNHSKFIQVKQVKAGEIELHFVSDSISEEEARNLFDLRNLDLDVAFVKRSEPFRTPSGKVNLLIK
ncbi:phenylacetate--CoA ligase family protein [Arenibacter antarcticus]|uniref:Phenylacetate-CoA ligase n=2 Tax=Arenibacter TaxID=178469 RepID=A0ABW5VHW3_9FLAO